MKLQLNRLVSIIVPNHGRDLSLLRKSVEDSTYKEVEFIEVNLGMERSKQRNIGMRQAKGKYLLILDSDQTISPGLISECVDLVQMGFSAVFIPEVLVVKSFFGRVRKFEREFYTGTAVDVPRFVRARNCPEFDETMTGPEDSDFGNRLLGLKTISENVLFHHDDVPVKEYFRKKAYYTKSMANYAKKHPQDLVLNLWYRGVGIFIEKSKWKKLFRHPILSFGIVGILLIRAWIYFTNK